ncbi:UNVERIFIED_CONTAM: hypothetical protein K2H54_051627, partial [Gekko kuhli]
MFPASTMICLGVISTLIAVSTVGFWPGLQAVVVLSFPMEAFIGFEGGSHRRWVQSSHLDGLDNVRDCCAARPPLDVGTDRDSNLGSELASLLSPDDVNVLPASVSPTEDLTTLADQLIRMARVLKLQHSAAQ